LCAKIIIIALSFPIITELLSIVEGLL
jgi:hypothetical protein